MDAIVENIACGHYRDATEKLVEKMRGLAEEQGDSDMLNELEIILSKLFDLPNIDWKKAEEYGAWEMFDHNK